ncbi:MAG: TolC family protein [Mariprofundaceae bacterium]|nr:TolC family protein [Mariprofundaceae bacterium]
MTLKAAVTQAMLANRQIRAADASIDVAKARLTQAKAARLPQLSLESTAMRSNAPMTVFGSRLSQQAVTATDFIPSSLNYPAPITQFQSRIVLDLPLYRGGALSSSIAQAEAQEQLRGHHKVQTQQQIIYRVIAAYSDALRAQHAQQVARQAVKSATAHVNTAKHMLAKGMVLRSDVMDAEVHQLNAAVAVKQAGNSASDAKDRLRQLLAMGINHPIALLPWVGLNSKYAGDDEAQWVKRGLRYRAELAQEGAQLDALKAKETTATAAFKPTLGLQVAQEWNNNTVLPQHGNTTVIAALRWNIFAGGADRAAQHAAEAASMKQVLMLDDLRQSIVVAVKHALRQQHEINSRWQMRKQALAQANESLRIHTLRFRQGIENINSMLDAQTRTDRAAEAVVQARFDHQMAQASLMLAAGVLNQEAVSP